MKSALRSVAIMLLSAQGIAEAVNLRWLEYSPVRYFSDEDWELARSAADDALRFRADGEAAQWHNATTGNSGSSMPLRSLERDGKPCRELAVENRAKGMSGRGVFLFCLQPSDEWKISPAESGPDDVPVAGNTDPGIPQREPE